MEINVGEYIRFKNGNLGIVEEYEYDKNFDNGHTIYLKGKVCGMCCKENDFKHSKDIIKVLEKGDICIDYNNDLYVVDHIDGNYVFTTTKVNKTTTKTLVDYQIKKVMTKQQFEANAYTIEKER